MNDLLEEADRLVPSVVPATAMELLAEMPEAVVVDVRDAYEFARCHIGRSINVPRGQLEFHIEDLLPNQDQLVLLVCRAGGRSLLAGRTLQTMGYTRVLSLAGGIERWAHEKLPVETVEPGTLVV